MMSAYEERKDVDSGRGTGASTTDVDKSSHSEKAIDFRDSSEDEEPPSPNALFAVYNKLVHMRFFNQFERIPYRMFFDEQELQFGEWSPMKERAMIFFQTQHNITFNIAQPSTHKMTGCFQQVHNVSFCYVALLHQGMYHFYGFVSQRVDKPVTSLGIKPTVWISNPVISAVKYFKGEQVVDDFLADFFENEFEKVNTSKINAVADFVKRNTVDH
jgi:hypothetical protein